MMACKIASRVALSGLLLVVACDPGSGDDAELPGDDAGAGSDDAELDDAGVAPGDDEPDASEPDDDDPGGEDPGDDDEPDDGMGTACDNPGEARACELDGVEGTQFCSSSGGEIVHGAPTWGPCLDEIECTPGVPQDCGLCDVDEEDCGLEGLMADCELDNGVPTLDADGCNTPLVLSFDGAPVALQPAAAASFDINDAGGCITTDWPSAVTPWLALDRDGSGSIETGRELFGSGTRLDSGTRASNGFAALAELDDNRDGRIDAADARFAELVLWGDEDADKQATLTELQPLAMRGILSIELDDAIDPRCDARGNCEMQRAAFTYLAEGGAVRQGEVVDIYLACQ